MRHLSSQAVTAGKGEGGGQLQVVCSTPEIITLRHVFGISYGRNLGGGAIW